MTNIWGKPIWEFIHTFCFHIDAEYYTMNKQLICKVLEQICTTLPCEFCNTHARKYIVGNLNHIKIDTKEKLKSFFIDFHNNVNKRLNKKVFNDENKYLYYNLNQTYKQFSRVYNGRMYNLKSFHYSRKRENVLYLMKLIINNCYRYVKEKSN